MLEMVFQRARQHHALDIAAHRRQVFRRQRVVDARHLLFDNGAFIEIACHVVRRRPDDFYPAIESLQVGIRAFEAGQERVVDIDGASGKLLAQLGRENLHVARQHHDIGLLFAQDVQHLLFLRLLVLGIDRQVIKWNAVPFHMRLEIGMIGNHGDDIHGKHAGFSAVEKIVEAMAVPRNQDGHAGAAALFVQLPAHAETRGDLALESFGQRLAANGGGHVELGAHEKLPGTRIAKLPRLDDEPFHLRQKTAHGGDNAAHVLARKSQDVAGLGHWRPNLKNRPGRVKTIGRLDLARQPIMIEPCHDFFIIRMNKKTHLYQEHVKLDAKMAPFAGYDMPINYALGVIKEHEWTRTNAGLFDVSHMGQAMVSGEKATEFFGRLTPSSFVKTPNSRAKYTVLTNEKGGIIDDLIITRVDANRFFVVFNAGRKEVDIAWFKKNLPAGVTFTELSDHALVALQGPKAERALTEEFPDSDLVNMPYMTLREAKWKDVDVIITRLGYTGEDGFEISIPAARASEFWNALLANPDVKPIGLAARDSLRLEMGYPLYGHDLTEETTPTEANLSWVMSKDHSGYIGAANIKAEPARKRMGVKLLDAGIAREGSKIYSGSEMIGELTSGGFSPSLKMAIGQGYIKTEFSREGQPVEVEVRGKRIPAEITGLAFMPARTKSSSLSALPIGERAKVRGNAAN